MPELAGMMSAEDVAEAVMFVLTRAAEPPHPRGGVPAGHGAVVGMSDEVVRWGVLSTANINRKVVPATQTADRCEVVAIGSRDLARARAAASEFGIARAYGSYEEVLADPEVDAVYNPLPNDLHERWTIAAAEAGKHVLCEKPWR
jgi:hypothetical protein